MSAFVVVYTAAVDAGSNEKQVEKDMNDNNDNDNDDDDDDNDDNNSNSQKANHITKHVKKCLNSTVALIQRLKQDGTFDFDDDGDDDDKKCKETALLLSSLLNSLLKKDFIKETPSAFRSCRQIITILGVAKVEVNSEANQSKNNNSNNKSN
eukprot:Pgem_evm1s3812